MSPSEISLDGTALSPADIARAVDPACRVRIDDSAWDRVRRGHEFARRTASERALYGQHTGVGANRGVRIDDPAAHAQRLLRSHATSSGPPRAPERVRATAVVRLNQLLAGGSGVDQAVVAALARLLDRGPLPTVLEWGGLGTGDLAVLARLALALTDDAGAPLVLGASDALPLLSSNAASIADAALAGAELERVAESAIAVAAATFVAVDGNAEAFSPAAERTMPFPGPARVCARLRELVPNPAPPARIQDPFGLRALPPVHGALFDALAHLAHQVSALSAVPAENPVFLPDVGVAHHGGFHVAGLAQALDTVRSALAQSAQLSTARLGLLIDPDFTALPAFLGDGTSGASGVMGCEYAAGAALAELRLFATPAAVQSVSVSRGAEDDASFATLAARLALDAVPGYRAVLAAELVAAVRALRMRERAVPTAFAGLPDDTADRDLSDDLALAADRL